MSIIIDVALPEMQFTAGYIVERAKRLLLDESFDRWDRTELLIWINDAVKAVVSRDPSALSLTSIVELEAGAYQTAPDGTVGIHDITRNVSGSGVFGRAIKLASRRLLDDQVPDWYGKTPASTILHYTYDERSPKTFYVYPPAAAGTRVEMVRYAVPDDIDSEDDGIPLTREYLEPLLNFVLYRAFSKDDESSSDARAAGYYAAFKAALDDDIGASVTTSPNGASK